MSQDRTRGSPRVLQVGCGGFGPTHLEAWRRLGFRDALWVADPDPEARARAAACDIPAARIVADYRPALGEVDLVDVVAATERHVEICLAAIAAGKDVFVEKPLALVADDARRLAAAVDASDRVLQVGYYYRHHPLTGYARTDRAGGTRRPALPVREVLGIQAGTAGRRLYH
jgi:predicted dehydrogenase